MHSQFKDNLAELKRSLEESLASSVQAREAIEAELSTLKRVRRETIERCVGSALPDIREATIDKLKAVMPGAFTRAIDKELRKATLRVPFWQRVTFRSDEYLADMNPQLKERLYSQLIAFVDSSRQAPKGFEELRPLDKRMNELAYEQPKIAKEIDEMRKQLDGLQNLQKSSANGHLAHLNPRVVRSVALSAQRVRDMRDSRVVERRKFDESSKSDDGLSIIDMWLLSQLFDSGSSSGHHAEEVFRGHGGSTSGSGAEASFDADATSRLVADPADTNLGASIGAAVLSTSDKAELATRTENGTANLS